MKKFLEDWNSLYTLLGCVPLATVYTMIDKTPVTWIMIVLLAIQTIAFGFIITNFVYTLRRRR